MKEFQHRNNRCYRTFRHPKLFAKATCHEPSQSTEWTNVIEDFLGLRTDLRHWSTQLQRVRATLMNKCRGGDLVICGNSMGIRTRKVDGEWAESLVIDGEEQ